jgi:hypothetical protein
LTSLFELLSGSDLVEGHRRTLVSATGPERDLHVLKSPQLWPVFPYLRVDRRHKDRPGMAMCFLVASSDAEVEPIVHVHQTWPPGEDFDADSAVKFHYADFPELLRDGWRVVYLA